MINKIRNLGSRLSNIYRYSPGFTYEKGSVIIYKEHYFISLTRNNKEYPIASKYWRLIKLA